MSTGLLLITHDQIGKALLDTALGMIGEVPLKTATIAVTAGTNPEKMAAKAGALVEKLDQGAGVLILTDMFGSTPSNIAASFLDRPQVMVVTGLNLPMLIRVLNYPHLGLAELAQKATSGGHDGIIWSSSR